MDITMCVHRRLSDGHDKLIKLTLSLPQHANLDYELYYKKILPHITIAAALNTCSLQYFFIIYLFIIAFELKEKDKCPSILFLSFLK